MLTEIELKEKLIATISTTNDSELLHQISKLIDLETEINEVYELSPEESDAVREGLNQLDNGQFISHTEANSRINKWLRK